MTALLIHSLWQSESTMMPSKSLKKDNFPSTALAFSESQASPSTLDSSPVHHWTHVEQSFTLRFRMNSSRHLVLFFEIYWKKNLYGELHTETAALLGIEPVTFSLSGMNTNHSFTLYPSLLNTFRINLGTADDFFGPLILLKSVLDT